MKDHYRSAAAREINARELETPEGRLMYLLGLVRLARADTVARRANGNNGFALKRPRKERKA